MPSAGIVNVMKVELLCLAMRMTLSLLNHMLERIPPLRDTPRFTKRQVLDFEVLTYHMLVDVFSVALLTAHFQVIYEV